MTKITGPGSDAAFFFSECTLSTKTNPKTAAKDPDNATYGTFLEYEENGFHVTGVADYIVFTQGARKFTKEQSELHSCRAERLRAHLSTRVLGKVMRATIHNLDEAFTFLEVENDDTVNVLLVEAKSLEFDTYRKLQAHIPQTVMEAYVW